MIKPNITIAPDQDLPYWLERTGSFESAHQLEGHPKCGNLHGHSYNYIVIIQANTLTDKLGFILDFSHISAYFNRYDHSGDIITTSCEEFTETACKDLLSRVESAEAKVHVFVQETGKSWAGYSLGTGRTPAVKPALNGTPPVRRAAGKLTATAWLGEPSQEEVPS